MRAQCLMTVASLFCALVGAIATRAICADPPARTETPQLTIIGTVRLSDGSAAAGAVVTSLRSGVGLIELESVTADDEGRFELCGDTVWDARLHVRSADATEHGTLRIPATLTRTDLAKPVEIQLSPAREVAVSVISSGQPAEGVHVVAVGHEYRIEGQTDGDGRLALRIPAEVPLQAVAAWHPELGVAGLRDKDGIKENSVECSLLAPAPHTIRVVDITGQPVPGLVLGPSVYTEESEWIMVSEIRAARVRTDENGVAVIPWVPRDATKYIDVDFLDGVWKEFYTERGELPHGETILHICRKFPVEGRLKMPAGASAAGLMVVADGFGPDDTNTIDLVRARAQPDGTFTIWAAPEHAYAVQVVDANWASDAWKGLILRQGQSGGSHPILDVYSAARVEFRATCGPQMDPVPNALIEVRSEHELSWRDAKGQEQGAIAGISYWLKTDARGQTRAGLGKGAHQIALVTDVWSEEREIEVAGNKPVAIELHRPWLKGRKVNGRLTRNGAPHAPSEATFIRAWSKPSRLNEKIAEPNINRQGTFEIAMDAGDILVIVRDPKHKLGSFAEVSPTDTDVEAALVPLATYSGMLVDIAGEPLRDEPLRLIVKGSDSLAAAEQQTDHEGRFRFDDVVADVPVTLELYGERHSQSRYWRIEDRYFVPGEKRENARVTVRWRGSPSPKPSDMAQSRERLEQRLATAMRDARLNAMRALVILQGDSSQNILQTTEHILNYDLVKAVSAFLPVVISEETVASEPIATEKFAAPRPDAAQIVLIACDDDGNARGAICLDTSDVLLAVCKAADFLREHEPPIHDANEMLARAREEAQQSGRRIWLVRSGTRCWPCRLLARWMDDQHGLLEKDFVVVKILGGRDLGSYEIFEPLTGGYSGIPWWAITEPDGTVLATSRGPLGHEGYPSSVEGIRHLRDLLARTAPRLTPEDIDQLVAPLERFGD